jgi:hypothetical protein
MWYLLRNPSRVARRSYFARFMPTSAFFATLGAAIQTTGVFIVDIFLVATTRHRTHRDSYGILTETWGNAVRDLRAQP